MYMQIESTFRISKPLNYKNTRQSTRGYHKIVGTRYVTSKDNYVLVNGSQSLGLELRS